MTTELALLAAIIAKPDDDQPRLVYADWLEENGHYFTAKFIREQIAGLVRTVPMTTLFRLEPALRTQPPQWKNSAKPGRATTVANGIELHWRRGFISEVRCTEEQWVGGECERCEGRGFGSLDDGLVVEECQRCHGTGHIPGIGQRIAQTHPVERVVTEKRPYQRRWYCGTAGPIQRTEAYVAQSIFHLMDGESQHYTDTHHEMKRYPTEQAALDAYSRAAIEWVRRPQTFTANFYYAGELQPMPMDDQE